MDNMLLDVILSIWMKMINGEGEGIGFKAQGSSTDKKKKKVSCRISEISVHVMFICS